MAHYEIEIKSLLGERDAAETLKNKLSLLDPNTRYVTRNTQLNHYFEGGDINILYAVTKDFFGQNEQAKLAALVERGNDFSVRTRRKDDTVLLVVKAAVDGGTSANAVSRLEFEEPVNFSLDELDALAHVAGYRYQAKWSRDREEYLCRDTTVCIDRNAGYGYLAEFERIVPAEGSLAEARSELVSLMAALGVSELPQERLHRMFEYYNQNWTKYYGTDKTFTID